MGLVEGHGPVYVTLRRKNNDFYSRKEKGKGMSIRKKERKRLHTFRQITDVFGDRSKSIGLSKEFLGSR